MFYPLKNVPTAKSKIPVTPDVAGESIELWCGSGDMRCMIGNFYISEHMLGRPAALRQMVAREMASLVEMARDTGYRHAQADIRLALGL